MKLIRFGMPGEEKPGVIINDSYCDVSSYIKDYDEQFFADDGLNFLKEIITDAELPQLEKDIRLGPPVARPSKIICIGLNYSDHAAESKMQVPAEPVIFFKSTTALCGPNDDLIIPRNSTKTDWEVELAFVISKKTSYITEQEAMDHVAGFVLHNDYSERAFQIERSGQWVKGKSADSFAPLGPFLATKDEIADIDNLKLWLKVNGKMMQDGNTKNMIFKIPFLVSYISQFMTLLPGDIISTGTPAGVGMGQKPEPVYIKNGDVIELGIDGLGSSRQVAVAYK
ncbi:MAG TPA: fumarylacetoacetate hydrolase family protein [Chitinophagaceae bacterium]|jgi:2-keto-4-pentenoate hydratase/2-oxohepta-3-ene-1,7-dioic acid hydratase in catechol pathway|nr:fumarylacetoacetate hydrolase family protein [Chitinophagaceae bacterium]